MPSGTVWVNDYACASRERRAVKATMASIALPAMDVANPLTAAKSTPGVAFIGPTYHSTR